MNNIEGGRSAETLADLCHKDFVESGPIFCYDFDENEPAASTLPNL